jgi:hypothetical protein
MQPLGSGESPFSPSITFFTQKYFSSSAYPTTTRRGRKFFDNFHGPVKSLIVVGKSQWTLVDMKGKKYCLATNFDTIEPLPICVVPDVSLTHIGKPAEISAIHRGCSDDVTFDTLITLEDCEYFGEKKNDPNELSKCL